MSKNIEQIYTANPITSNNGTDLMYFGRSPYGVGDDVAMTYQAFSGQFGAPYEATSITSTNDTNVTLTLGGIPATAVLKPVSLTMGWSGTLSPSRGGLGTNSVPTNGQIPIGNGTNYTIANISGGSYINLNNGVGSISIAANASTSATASTLCARDGNANALFNNYNANQNTISAGGTSILTAASAKTQIVSGSGATTVQLPDATTLAVGWTFYINNNTASTVTVVANDGITTVASMPAGQYVQLYNTSTGSTNGVWDFHWLVPTNMANGQVMIGATTTGPKAANLTAGSGITITNAANSITISASGTITWNSVAGTTQTAAANNGYYISNASQTTVSIPATISAGSVVSIAGNGAGGWILQCAGGQTINSSAGSTSSGGTITSLNRYDAISILCVVANTTFTVLSLVGTPTIA